MTQIRPGISVRKRFPVIVFDCRRRNGRIFDYILGWFMMIYLFIMHKLYFFYDFRITNKRCCFLIFQTSYPSKYLRPSLLVKFQSYFCPLFLLKLKVISFDWLFYVFRLVQKFLTHIIGSLTLPLIVGGTCSKV